VRLPRLTGTVLALAALASACASDEPIGDLSSTTVPVATTAAANPDDTFEPEGTTTAEAEPPSDPRSVIGDLLAANVASKTLAGLSSPIDTAVSARGELWIAERGGTIVVVDPSSGDVGDTILDISAETSVDTERGLLGLAVDENHLYINFTGGDGNTNVDAFTLDSDGRPGARRHLLLIEQPFPNHNGGGLAIGPDGLLYIGVGDGGAANDPLGAGQDPTQILGSILRIEPTPEGEEPYSVPVDNPFADGVDGQPEIFLVGVRNPWRFSFDPITDDLWVADVGQNEWEEVDLLLGANGWGRDTNLGWNLREGTNRFTGERPADNVDPVFEYPHAGSTPSGCSISGGQVYRGLRIPDLVGSYVFGDFCASTVWAISIVDGTVVYRDLGVPVSRLVGVTRDPAGELLVLSLDGDISRLVAE
jgi:glucose/arabinose dehydrogenase